MINFFSVTDGCLAVLGVVYFIRELLKIVCFIIPMGLILFLTIDIAKQVISSEIESKKVINIAIKRIIYTVVIFILPETLFGLFQVLGLQVADSQSCWNYVNDISVEEVRSLMSAQEEALQREVEQIEKESLEKAKEKKENKDKFKNSVYILSNSIGNVSTSGTVVGQTYNLTNDQLRGIANLCEQEQGTPEGAAAEASLMANRFELFGSNYGVGGDGLFSYVRDSGWFANSKTHMSDTVNVKEEIVDAVRDVLVIGNRTLPLYVDEHDCYNCCSLGVCINRGTNNGVEINVKDRTQYEQDVTVLYNTAGAKYTFYVFPTEVSDPFGYTESAWNKIKG